MDREITTDWISKNIQLLEKAGIINGVGVPGTWYTKGLKFILWLNDRKRSIFYNAAAYHDVLYWTGNTSKDRLKADYIFLKKMIETSLQQSNNKVAGYLSIAVFYFLAVRLFGNSKTAFNDVYKRNITDVKIELLLKNG